jgi:hypothetical protein
MVGAAAVGGHPTAHRFRYGEVRIACRAATDGAAASRRDDVGVISSGSATALVLASIALMLLSGIEKKRLVFGYERRCRHCRRPVASCSCPQRRRGRS